MNNKGQSSFEYTEISNSVTSSKTFNRANVYYIDLINNTAFEITVLSRDTGEIRVPANSNIKFFGSVWATIDINYKVRFNSAAPNTDFLVITTTSLNSIDNGCIQ